jgi:prevent-host-death family protein
MSKIMPKTASSKDIQRNYRALFDEVVSTEEPLVIINNSKPEVVILSIKMYESLNESVEKHELEMAKKAVENYNSEKITGKLKKLSSLSSLA